MNIDYKSILEYYNDKLRKFGATAEGMDWKNQESQYLRFDILTKYIDFSNKPNILDVGCGVAEYKFFLESKHLTAEYFGIDLNPEMVELANQRFDSKVAVAGNILDLSGEKMYDYVIASGTFNTKLMIEDSEWRDFFLRNIEKMYWLCKKAVIFNGMTQFVDWRYDRLYYIHIEDFANFIVTNLSRKFIIDHSYPLFEVTYAIYK